MKNSLKLHRRVGLARLILLATTCWWMTVGAMAHPYAGIYAGSYATSTGTYGTFALFVGDDGWGGMVTVDGSGGGGGFEDGFTVNTDGSFTIAPPSGGVVNGRIAGETVTGTITGSGASGSLNGSRKSGAGAKQGVAGYYSGSASVTGGSMTSVIRMIIAADGSYYGGVNGVGTEDEDGFTGTLTTQNVLNFTSRGGTAVTATLNASTCHVTGTANASGTTGTIVMDRTRAFAACSYALSAGGTNCSATVSGGSFLVSSACAWQASTAAGWIHPAGAGTGSGTVYFTVDANPNAAFRSGSITVGDQSYTITQGPKGYAWNKVLGWLFDAGGGWYHHDGYGWMWFSTGQWIWSSSLKGWVATTDANSRTLWSTQFRWLTPSASDPYQAETTALGRIYVGKYGGAAIPDSWVVSERFGYVWANGDGQWFYSNNYGWLGVTPEGGIWCVSQGRFL